MPTFKPSMNVGKGTKAQCHFFVTNGQIRYQGDCYHKYVGKTIDLPDLPDWVLEYANE